MTSLPTRRRLPAAGSARSAAWPAVFAVTLTVMACGQDRSPIAPAPPPAASSDPLKAAAAGLGRLVGTAVAGRASGRSPVQRGGVAGVQLPHRRIRNEVGWRLNSTTGGTGLWRRRRDRCVPSQQGMQIKGHALIWHGSVRHGSAGSPPATARRRSKSTSAPSVTTTGGVHAWDVVNEAIADGWSGLRDTVFRQKLGMGSSPTPSAWPAQAVPRRCSSTTIMAARG